MKGLGDHTVPTKPFHPVLGPPCIKSWNVERNAGTHATRSSITRVEQLREERIHPTYPQTVSTRTTHAPGDSTKGLTVIFTPTVRSGAMRTPVCLRKMRLCRRDYDSEARSTKWEPGISN